MMFRHDGFVTVASQLGAFSINRLNGDLKLSLLSQFRRRIADYQRNRDAEIPSGTSWAQPIRDSSPHDATDEDAKREVSAKDLQEYVKHREATVLAHFLKVKPLFVTGPLHDPIPVTAHVASSDQRYSPLTGAKTTWNYLHLDTMTVSVEQYIKLFDAIEQAGAYLMTKVRSPLFLNTFEAQVSELRSRMPNYIALRPYEGYSLSITSGDADDKTTISAMFERFLTGGSVKEKSLPMSGRPRKAESAARAYSSRFPDGHGGMTWKSVLAALRVEDGIIVSEDTLRRAVKLSAKP